MELIQQGLDLLRHLDVHLNKLAEWNLPGFYAITFLIIFCETGLVVTPFLPGDSLLFALGAITSYESSPLNLPFMIVLLTIAAILGDAVNYAIGYRLGPAVFRYENSWLLNKNHLARAHAFYEKYGGKTIILARFIPIIRTFAPFVAGIGRMNYTHFALYNVTGGIAWVVICVLAGYWFGQIEWVKKNFELVVIAVIVISVLPMAVELLLHWFRQRSNATLQKPSTPAPVSPSLGADPSQPSSVQQ